MVATNGKESQGQISGMEVPQRTWSTDKDCSLDLKHCLS